MSAGATIREPFVEVDRSVIVSELLWQLPSGVIYDAYRSLILSVSLLHAGSLIESEKDGGPGRQKGCWRAVAEGPQGG